MSYLWTTLPFAEITSWATLKLRSHMVPSHSPGAGCIKSLTSPKNCENRWQNLMHYSSHPIPGRPATINITNNIHWLIHPVHRPWSLWFSMAAWQVMMSWCHQIQWNHQWWRWAAFGGSRNDCPRTWAGSRLGNGCCWWWGCSGELLLCI